MDADREDVSRHGAGKEVINMREDARPERECGLWESLRTQEDSN